MKLQTYLGPYFYCEIQQVPKTEVRRLCSNTQCTRSHSACNFGTFDRFCNACGSEIKNKDVPVIRDNIDSWPIQEKIKETLWQLNNVDHSFSKNFHLWLSNRKLPSRNFHQSDESEKILNFTSGLIPLEIKEFEEFFVEERQVLIDAYGDVITKWGLIQYYD